MKQKQKKDSLEKILMRTFIGCAVFFYIIGIFTKNTEWGYITTCLFFAFLLFIEPYIKNHIARKKYEKQMAEKRRIEVQKKKELDEKRRKKLAEELLHEEKELEEQRNTASKLADKILEEKRIGKIRTSGLRKNPGIPRIFNLLIFQ